jgi:DNA-binding response OmpR family regulator
MRKIEISTEDSVIAADSIEEVSADSLGTILIVEDDSHMQSVFQRLFLAEHYDVVSAEDGQKGLDCFEVQRPVAVVLDLMLPQISGRELCQRFRALSSDTPVIVVSAITDVTDKVHLLELGADDYVTKPFSPRELMARVQAAIRRRRRFATSTVCCFANCELDFQRMKAKRNGVPILLTSHEYRLLKFLAEHPDRVVSREELLKEVWRYECYPTTRTVDNQMLRLRQKLEPDPSNPRYLLTVYGAGYKFVPQPDGERR